MNDPDPFAASVLAADPRARRVLALLRAMSEREAECWLQQGQRIVRGDFWTAASGSSLRANATIKGET